MMTKQQVNLALASFIQISKLSKKDLKIVMAGIWVGLLVYLKIG